MKRRVATTSPTDDGKVVHAAALESNVFARLHNLVAHCAVTRYDDGSARKPGWFNVKTIGQTWVVQVKDPDGGVCLSATGASLDDALALADLLLGAEDAPWEVDYFLASNGKGKKK
jgi:hypothetical protein